MAKPTLSRRSREVARARLRRAVTHLTCPGCKAAYPLAAVRAMATFRCSVCGQTMVVPMAVAPTPPAAPAAVPPRRPAPAPARRDERRHAAPPPAKGMNTTVVAVIGIVVLAGGALLVASMSNSAAPASQSPSGSTTTAAPVAPKADPEKDVAAWKALSAEERAARAR